MEGRTPLVSELFYGIEDAYFKKIVRKKLETERTNQYMGIAKKVQSRK